MKLWTKFRKLPVVLQAFIGLFLVSILADVVINGGEVTKSVTGLGGGDN